MLRFDVVLVRNVCGVKMRRWSEMRSPALIDPAVSRRVSGVRLVVLLRSELLLVRVVLAHVTHFPAKSTASRVRALFQGYA